MVQYLPISQCIHHINITKGGNQMITSIDIEKASDKIQYPFVIKTLNKVGIGWMYPNIIEATYNKPAVNITLNSEKLKL